MTSRESSASYRREILQDLADHPGWKLFVEQLEKHARAARSVIIDAKYAEPIVDIARSVKASGALYAIKSALVDLYATADMKVPEKIRDIFE